MTRLTHGCRCNRMNQGEAVNKSKYRSNYDKKMRHYYDLRNFEVFCTFMARSLIIIGMMCINTSFSFGRTELYSMLLFFIYWNRFCCSSFNRSIQQKWGIILTYDSFWCFVLSWRSLIIKKVWYLSILLFLRSDWLYSKILFINWYRFRWSSFYRSSKIHSNTASLMPHRQS